MLKSLSISALRNLLAAKISPGVQFNVLVGANGSGKTSLLEAIYYLGMGRSFRTHLHNRVINHQADEFTIFAEIYHQPQIDKVGVSRSRKEDPKIKINGETAQSTVELASLLPLQLIYPGSHELLSSGPKPRRQFIDWGVFHVENAFVSHWQRLQRILKQRNAGLKSQQNQSLICHWDEDLTNTAGIITEMRQQYVNALKPVFGELMQQLLSNIEVELNFSQGWNKDKSLTEVLQLSFTRDCMLGYTQYGPHRADLNIRSNRTPAHDALSQGQQKLVVYALRLAQGMLMRQHTKKSCIYLIDDLPAELDQQKRRFVGQVLANLQSQVFVTGNEENELAFLSEMGQHQLFHVKQGTIPTILTTESCFT